MRMRNSNLHFGKNAQFRMLAADAEECPVCHKKNLCNLEGELVETADAWYGRTQAEQNLRPSRTRIVSPKMKHQCGR